MAVTIRPIPGTVHLQVTGDIETVLAVPFDDADRFLLGLSDGTLLLGTYDEVLRCGWSVAKEGAGVVSISSDEVSLDWRAEWVTASIYDANLLEPAQPTVLPLFPELDRQAA